MWEAQRQYFSAKCDVCLIENRGISQSGTPPGIWRLEDMADDVISVIDALGWEVVHLIGQSLGHLIINAAASRLEPGRVRSITGISPVSVSPLGGIGGGACCPPFGIWKFSGFCKEIDLLIACSPKDRIDAVFSINWPTAYLERDAYDCGPGTNRDAVLRSMINAQRGQGRVPEATMVKQALAWAIHTPPKCVVPTLFIIGEEDALVFANRVRSKVTAAQVRGQRVEILAISGAGHSCHVQCAIAVTCALEAFILRHHSDDVDDVSETTRLSGTMER